MQQRKGSFKSDEQHRKGSLLEKERFLKLLERFLEILTNFEGTFPKKTKEPFLLCDLDQKEPFLVNQTHRPTNVVSKKRRGPSVQLH